MALTMDCKAVNGTTTEEYLEYLEKNIPINETERIFETGGMLKGISDQSDLAVTYINQYLKNFLVSGLEFRYGTQSFVLGFNGSYILRMNIWLPLDNTGKTVEEFEEKSYFYYYPHDHNFNLLTVGHYGKGYRTQIYEYDRSSIIGYPGEYVEIEELEDTTLPEGKVMAYRACKDIHTQMPPEELSISLNLLANETTASSERQYRFDLDKSQIHSEVAESRLFTKSSVFKLAGALANAETEELLIDIAQKKMPSPLRISALDSLSIIANADTYNEIANGLRDEKDLLLKRYLEESGNI